MAGAAVVEAGGGDGMQKVFCNFYQGWKLAEKMSTFEVRCVLFLAGTTVHTVLYYISLFHGKKDNRNGIFVLKLQ